MLFPNAAKPRRFLKHSQLMVQKSTNNVKALCGKLNPHASKTVPTFGRSAAIADSPGVQTGQGTQAKAEL